MTVEALLMVIAKEISSKTTEAVIDFIKFYFRINDCFTKIQTLTNSICSIIENQKEKEKKLKTIRELICKIYSRLYGCTNEDSKEVHTQFFNIISKNITEIILGVEQKVEKNIEAVQEAELTLLTNGIHFLLKEFKKSAELDHK